MQSESMIKTYLQYSKRIAIFGVVQWAVLALTSLVLVLLSSKFDLIVDEWVTRVVNNVVTSSSALAIAICSGYYAHSAYDNNLKQKINAALEGDTVKNEKKRDNG